MAVAAGIIIAWPGTVASIPAGWTRKALLDARYLRGAGTAGGSGGSATHYHTGSGDPIIPGAHTHTQNPHTHTPSGTTGDSIGYTGVTVGASVVAEVAHSHAFTTIGYGTGTNQHTAVTNQASSNDTALFRKVIWVESDGTPADLPLYCLAWTIDSVPAGWEQPTAEKGAYLKGVAAGLDGGGVMGGSPYAHVHGANAHNHTQNPHYHEMWTGYCSATTTRRPSAPGTGFQSEPDHKHKVLHDGGYATNQTEATYTLTNTRPEPPYRSLRVVRRIGAGDAIPVGIITVWTGSVGSVPAYWVVCNGLSGTPDMTGRLAKGSEVDGDINTANSGFWLKHMHDGEDHTHTQASHYHGDLSIGANDAPSPLEPILGAKAVLLGHTHTALVLGTTSTVASNQDTMVAWTEESSILPFYNVIFIQYLGEPPPRYRCVVSSVEEKTDRVHVAALLEDTLVYRRGVFDVSAPSIADLPVVAITSCGLSVDIVHAERDGKVTIHYTNSATALIRIQSADAGETWS